MSYNLSPAPRRRLLTGAFWADAAERGIRTAAEVALATLGANQIGILDADWGTAGSLAGMAAVLSLLASVVAGSGGDPSTAGFTTTTARR
jgi:hypothetical protein